MPTEALQSYRSRAILGTVITFTLTSTISIILRLISKRLNRSSLTREDYTILIAQFLLYGMATAEILDVFVGHAGHHASMTPAWRVAASLKLLVAMQTFYAATLTLIKTSICLFYMRIFAVRLFRLACWAVIIFIACWGLMVLLTAFLLCQPLAYNWDQNIPGGRCANEPAAFIAVGVLDLVTDACVFILPLPMIWNLHVPIETRAALSAVFGLGLGTMVISALRIAALMATDFADITYSASYPLLWSFAEPALGITVACGPLLGPLFKQSRGLRKAHALHKVGATASKNAVPFERLTEGACERASVSPNELNDHSGVMTSVKVPSTSHASERRSTAGGIEVQTVWETQVTWKRS